MKLYAYFYFSQIDSAVGCYYSQHTIQKGNFPLHDYT